MLKSRLAFPLAALGIAVLTLLVVSVALVAAVRALPGRYAYYLPEPVQRLRHRSHPDQLPTPVLGERSSNDDMLLLVEEGRPRVKATEVVPTSQPDTPTSTPAQIPATHTPVPAPTLAPSPSPTPPTTLALKGMRHEHQGWNNCGPATVSMLLSYWGCEETQFDAAPILKPDSDDKNVSPSEIEPYVRDQGLEVVTRVNGDLDKVKELLQAGFPVILETWYVRDARDQLGHYRLIVGYDDAARQFITYDSLHGPDVLIGYRQLDELWRVFNRLYIVVYTPEKWDALASIIGPDLEDAAMYEHALEVARNEAVALPGDCVAYAECADWVTFSWFNAGSSLTALGRHQDAAAAYDKSRQLGLHFRMLWYQFGPYESYYESGRFEDVVTLANATLATAGNLEESYYWRGMARVALGNVAGARSDFRTALRYHEEWRPAMKALESLE